MITDIRELKHIIKGDFSVSQVAEKAKLSRTGLSLILNKKTSPRLKTLEIINQAIDELRENCS